MFILPRYIIRQHVGSFIFGLSVIIFIFLTNFIFQNLYKFIGKGLSLWTILEVIVLNMAWIVALAVPMAVLIAAVMTFGRLSEDNEITAMRTGGIGPFQIMRPMLGAAAVLAAGLILFNNIVLPEANHRARLLMSDIYRAKPALSFREGVFSSQVPDMRILIKRIDPDSPRIYGIIILDNSELPLRRTIVAENGSFVYESGIDRMILTLNSGEIHEVSEEQLNHYTRLRFNKHIISIPMEESGFRRTQTGYRGDREKSAGSMQKEIKLIKEEVKGYRKSAVLLLGQINPPLTQSLKDVIDSLSVILTNLTDDRKLSRGSARVVAENRERHLRERIEKLNTLSALIDARLAYVRKLSVEVHKKYSIPVACIVFILIGAPLGMMARKGGMAFSGGVSLVFFIIYWAFLIGGEELADRGFVHPTAAMWAANALLGGVGFWGTYKVSRLSSAISLSGFFRRLLRK